MVGNRLIGLTMALVMFLALSLPMAPFATTPALAVAGVTSVAPTFGGTGGGTAVTITGVDFMPGVCTAAEMTAVTTVTFDIGGTPAVATSIVFTSDTTITAVAAAHAAGLVSVTIAQGVPASACTGAGTTVTTAGLYTYVAPVATGVSPTSGPTAGGTVITITGTNLSGVNSVTISVPATGVVVNAAGTTVTATTGVSPVGTFAICVDSTLEPGAPTCGPAVFTYAAPTATPISIPTPTPLPGTTTVSGTVAGSAGGGDTVVLFNAGTGASFAATTSAAGAYSFSNVPPGTYRVTVAPSAPDVTGCAASVACGFLISSQVITVGTSPLVVPLITLIAKISPSTATSAAGVFGYAVNAATGVPIVGATVTATQGGTQVGQATTDANGRFEINGLPTGLSTIVTLVPSATVGLSCTIGGINTCTDTITLVAGWNDPAFLAVVGAGPVPLPITITGRVLNGTAPVANVQVSARCDTATGASCSFAFTGVTAADGSYTLQGNPGRYDIFVRNNGGVAVNSLVTTFVDALTGASFSGVDVQVRTADTTFTGVVRDSVSGSPIVGATLRVRLPSQASRANGVVEVASAVTTATGFSLQLAAGTYNGAEVTATNYQQIFPDLVLTAPSTSRDFSLRPLSSFPVQISGRVLNISSGLPGTSISNLQPDVSCLTASGSSCTTSSSADATGFTVHADLGKIDMFVPSSRNIVGVNSTTTTFVDATTAGTFTGRDVLVANSSTVVSGVVRDAATLAPLSGATVRFRIPQQASSTGGTVRIAEGTTGSTAAYSAPLAPGTYSARITTPGYQPRTVENIVVPTSPTFTQDFTLTAYPVKIGGTVRNGTTAVPNVSVSVFCRTAAGTTCTFEFFPSSRTDSAGGFTLFGLQGKYDFFVVNSGGAGVNSTATTLVDATNATPGTSFPADLAVASATTQLSGTVTDQASGLPLTGASVRLQIPPQASSGGGQLTVASATTDAGGAYSLVAAPATYGRLQADHSDYRELNLDNYLLSGGSVNQAFALQALSSFPVVITGRVLNTTAGLPGVAVPNVFVSTACLTTSGSGCTVASESTASDGSFTVRGDPGRYDLFILSSIGGAGVNSTISTFVDATAGGTFTGRDVLVTNSSAVVRGTVRDAGSAPLSDVTVRFRIPQQGSSTGGTLTVAITMTGATGAYSVPLAPGTYSARVTRTGYQTTTISNIVVPSQPTFTQDFTMPAYPVSITGQVRAGADTLANIAVSAACRTASGGACAFEFAPSNRTSSTGVYTLFGFPGRYDLFVANSGGIGVNSVGSTLVDATSGTTFTGRDITVASATTELTGTVTDEANGLPISGATVRVQILAISGAGDLTVASGRTDASGAYALFVAPATYQDLQADHSDYRTDNLAGYALFGASASQSFTLRALNTFPVTITGRVLSDGAVPVAGVSVGRACVTTTGAGCDSVTVTPSDANGNYTVRADPGRVDIFVRSFSGAAAGVNSTTTAFVDATSGTSFTNVNVPVSSSSALVRGRVTSIGGLPVADATVDLRIPQQGSRVGGLVFVARTRTDAAGAYELPVAPGSYSLRVSRFDHGEGLATVVAAGTVALDMVLTPHPVTISGRVLNGGAPVPNVSVSASCRTLLGVACASGFAGRTDSTGAYTLRGEAHLYELWVRNREYSGVNSLATTPVDATAGGTLGNVDLNVVSSTTLVTGTVTGPAPVRAAAVSLFIPSQVTSAGGGLEVVFARSNASGVYSVRVAPGTYLSRVNAPGFGFQALPDVVATGSVVNQDFGLRTFPLTITGRVINGNDPGVPVVNVRPSATCFSASGTCAFAFESNTDVNGFYTLHADPGRYDLYVRSSAGGAGVNSISSTLVDATTGGPIFSGRDIAVVTSTNVVSGTVTDAATSGPLAGTTVSLRIPQQANPGGTLAVAVRNTGADGRYSLPAATATYSALRASRTGYLTANANVEFVVPPGGVIRDFALVPAGPQQPVTAPDLDASSDTGPSNSDNVTVDNTPLFTGTAPHNSSVTLVAGIPDLTPGFIDPESILGVGMPNEATDVYAITTILLPDGQHTISAVATAGDTIIGQSSGTVVTIDTLSPVPPNPPTLVFGVPDGAFIPPATASGQAEPGNTVLLFATVVADPDGPGPLPDCNTNSAPLATTTANELGGYSTQFAPRLGTHVYCVTQTDVAGNRSPPSSGPPNLPGDAGKSSKTGAVQTPASGPSVAVTLPSTQPASTSGLPINFRATFSEVAYGFATGDATIAVSSACGTLQQTITPLDPNTLTPLLAAEPARTFNIQVVIIGQPTCASTTISARIGAGVAVNATGLGNSASPAPTTANTVTYTRPSVPDLTGPVTSLTGLPVPATVSPTGALVGAQPSSPNVTFGFSSNEAGSTFGCSLDPPAAPVFGPCVSPKHYPSNFTDPALANGSHTFWVRATDLAGNVGAPVSFTWTVDDDADGDGLITQWETDQFVTVPLGAGTVQVDLPGANPARRTVFLHIDWMENACASQKPSYDAIKLLWDAFNAQEIDLVVDLGPDSPLDYGQYTLAMSYANYLGPKWRALSRAGAVSYGTPLGTPLGTFTDGRYNWTRPSTTTATHFDDLKNRPGGLALSGRERVYRYVVFGDRYDSTGSSGVSRGRPERGSTDLIVSLGAFAPLTPCTVGGTTVQRGRGTVTQQATTLMHELGHGLGLEHGGDEPTNEKPTYLSIMNYAYQLQGLTRFGVAGVADYSDNIRAALSADEANLNETTALGLAGDAAAGWSVTWRCPFGATVTAPADGTLDWNCNGAITNTTLAVLDTNINGDGRANTDVVCIGPGSDGKLDTVPNAATLTGDDYRHRVWIREGDNSVCNSTPIMGDDVSLPPPGGIHRPPLSGHDDWAAIGIRRAGVGQIGFFAGAPPSTEPEDRDIRLLTKDKVGTVSLQVPSIGAGAPAFTISVLGSPSPIFDPSTIDGRSLRVGAAGPTDPNGILGDVDSDGLLDVTWSFPVDGAGFGPGAQPVCVEGNTTDLVAIQGCANAAVGNTAPLARNDRYVVAGAGPLVVPAPGVLGNDSDPDGHPLTAALVPGQAAAGLTLNPDGGFAFTPSHNGVFTFAYTASDFGLSSEPATITITVSNVAPTVGTIAAPDTPVRVGTRISTSASFADAGTADTHTAVWSWGDGTTSQGTISEAGGHGTVAGNHSYAAPGLYTIRLAVRGGGGATATAELKYVVIFDPEGGFAITGGSAEPVRASAGGRLQLESSARYPKDAAKPRGETQAQVSASSIDFRSTGYDYLVVAGRRAFLHGSGRVNRSGDYEFLLVTFDGGPNGHDTFRFRIRNKATGADLYDTQPGAPDDAEPTTPVRGSIFIGNGR